MENISYKASGGFKVSTLVVQKSGVFPPETLVEKNLKSQNLLCVLSLDLFVGEFFEGSFTTICARVYINSHYFHIYNRGWLSTQ